MNKFFVITVIIFNLNLHSSPLQKIKVSIATTVTLIASNYIINKTRLPDDLASFVFSKPVNLKKEYNRLLKVPTEIKNKQGKNNEKNIN